MKFSFFYAEQWISFSMLVYWWLILVKLQALVEQIWELDTPNLDIVDIQKCLF